MENFNVSTMVSLDSVFGKKQFAKAIYFCVDKSFYPYAMFVANQICQKYPVRDFDICIVSEDDLGDNELWQSNQLRIFKIKTGQLSSLVPSDERISFAAYFRIMFPSLVSADYDKLLYLDSDMFYQRGDLSKLFNLKLDELAVAAVRDTKQLRKRFQPPNDLAPFSLNYAPYFNSGMFLIDVSNWVKQDVTNQCISFAIENSEKIFQHDQTVLNIILRNKWVELPLVWNYLYTHQTLYFSGMFNICFYHFAGTRKPFNRNYGGFPHRFTSQYKAFFEKHYSHLKCDVQDGLNVKENYFKHFCVLVQHAFNAKTFLVNDDYFEDDWDVKFPEK